MMTAFARPVQLLVGRLRFNDIEITADFLRKKIVYFAMAWNGGCLSSGTVNVDRMLATFTMQDTTTLLKVPNQVIALHAAGSSIFSRITSFP